MQLVLSTLSLLALTTSATQPLDLTENEVDSHGPQHINLKSPASELHDEINILKLVNVSAKDQGVSIVEGPISSYPAYKFRLPYGNVPLANSSAVTAAFSSPLGFTVVFLYRQQRNTLGTLLSVNSPGRLTPWLQVVSNMKTGSLTLKYRESSSQRLHQVDWSLPTHHRKSPLAAWIWMSLSADFKTGTFRLDLDCLPSRFDVISQKDEDQSRIVVPQDSLVYFRQEPGRKKKFLGSIQVAKVLPYVQRERLWSCMDIGEKLNPEYRKPLV